MRAPATRIMGMSLRHMARPFLELGLRFMSSAASSNSLLLMRSMNFLEKEACTCTRCDMTRAVTMRIRRFWQSSCRRWEEAKVPEKWHVCLRFHETRPARRCMVP